MYQQQQPNNYSYFLQQSAARQAYSPYLKGRFVSSLEEVRAANIDFDGSIFYFPDVANNRIYTKQINLDGTASLNMYELKELINPTENNNTRDAYITREEFQATIDALRADLQSKKPKIDF